MCELLSRCPPACGPSGSTWSASSTIDELDQQLNHLPVVEDVSVVCITLPDDIRLAEAEKSGKALTDVTLPDHDILTVERGLYPHLGAVQVTQRVVGVV